MTCTVRSHSKASTASMYRSPIGARSHGQPWGFRSICMIETEHRMGAWVIGRVRKKAAFFFRNSSQHSGAEAHRQSSLRLGGSEYVKNSDHLVFSISNSTWQPPSLLSLLSGRSQNSTDYRQVVTWLVQSGSTALSKSGKVNFDVDPKKRLSHVVTTPISELME